MTSPWLDRLRARKAEVKSAANLAAPKKNSLRPSGKPLPPPKIVHANSDLTWCPLFQKNQKQIPLGAVDEEMLRVLALPIIALDTPRCPNREEYGKSLLNHATDDPEFRLNKEQIDGVYEYATVGGLLAPLAVGAGKEILSYLCAHVAHKLRGHERVVLLVPPSLLGQLWDRDLPHARRVLSLDGTPFTPVSGDRDERIKQAGSGYPGVYVVSYSTISTATGYETLKAIGATMYVLNEAQKVSRPTAVRTKRLMTIIRETEEATGKPVEMVALSGTITRKSVSEYAHLAKQCLKEASPVPIHPVAISTWSTFIDVETNVGTDPAFEASFRYLLEWATRNGAVITNDPKAPKTLQELLREAYAHRLHTAPGVVASTGQSVGASLIIHWQEPRMPDDESGWRVKELMRQVADEDLTPDGDEIDWAMHKWKWLWELSTGFYNSLIWPTADQERERHARSKAKKIITNDEAGLLIEQAVEHHKLLQDYHRELRHFLDGAHIPSCDTPALVAAEIVRQLVDSKVNHRLPEELIDAYRIARDANYDDLPERLSRPVRICNYKILAAVEWAKTYGVKGGLIWHHHPEIGRWLCEELTKAGVPFTYAPAGDNVSPYKPGLIVISYAHCEGKNLQHQNHQLFLEIRREASVIEQTLGRTHRQGQKADEVHADLFIANGFDLAMFSSILRDADYVQSSTKQSQKLAYASYDPIIPPLDPRLYVKLGILRERPSSVSVRVFDQITDDRQVADLFRSLAHKTKEK